MSGSGGMLVSLRCLPYRYNVDITNNLIAWAQKEKRVAFCFRIFIKSTHRMPRVARQALVPGTQSLLSAREHDHMWMNLSYLCRRSLHALCTRW